MKNTSAVQKGTDLSFLRDGERENPIDEQRRSDMEQEIQHMIADRVVSIERAIQEERRVQHRSNHMTEMLDKGAAILRDGD